MATITSQSLGELLKRLYAPWEIAQLINLTYPALGECARTGVACGHTTATWEACSSRAIRRGCCHGRSS